MSAFADLCFGDFTVEETQDFLCGNFSAVLASTLKISCKELSQSPDASQSDKDAASFSNHTEGEPTSPEDSITVLKQQKKKIKKKTRKHRKSNTYLSESSSSDEFPPSLSVEFDISSTEVKDNESEERQDASPSSSPLEETINEDGSVSVVPVCVQQLPWSNLNKKPRSSSSTSASSQEDQTRRKPSLRQGGHKLQDSGKKWDGENFSDGDISGSSGTNMATALDKKGAEEKPSGFTEKGHNKSNDIFEGDDQLGHNKNDVKCSQSNKIPIEEDVVEIKKNHSQTCSPPEKTTIPAPAPKRWADLFSKPSSTKQEAALNHEKSGQRDEQPKTKPVVQQLTSTHSGDQQQKRPDKQKLSYSRNGVDSYTSNTGIKQPGHRGSGQGKKWGVRKEQNLHQKDGKSSSTMNSNTSKTAEEYNTGNLETTAQNLAQDEKFKDNTNTTAGLPQKSEQEEPKSRIIQEKGSKDESLREGNNSKKNDKQLFQDKSRDHLVNQSSNVLPQIPVTVAGNDTPKQITNQTGNITTTEVNSAVKTEGRDEDGSQTNNEAKEKQQKEIEELISTEATTLENVTDCPKNEISKDVKYENNGIEDKTKNALDGSSEQPVEAINDNTEKESTPVDVSKEDQKNGSNGQKIINAVEPAKRTPWQSSMRWSDLFSKPKPKEEENNTKNPSDAKNINGHEKSDGSKQNQKPQKVLSLEEEEKLQLALDVAEIIRKCKMRTSDGDIPQPRGFINTSNWCYVNSTLQALISCPQLVMCLRALIPLVDRLKTVAPYSGAIVDLLKEFQYLEGDSSSQRKKVLNPLEVKGLPFEPHGVYKALEQLNNHLSKAKDHHQHDAEEYLTTSLGRIDHELMELIRMANQALEGGDHEELQSGEVWQEVYKKNKSTITRRIIANDTPITQIFGGDFRSYVYRNNKLDSSMVEPFLTLSLSVDGGVMTVEEALRNDLGKEDVIGDEGSVTKKLLFERLPKVMIIQLKKFSYDSSNGCVKLKKNLAFFDELTIDKDLMSPFVSSKYSADKDRSYRLSAVLYHAGRNAHCGHYVTAAKYIQQWLLFDDNFIKPIALKRVLQPEAREPYILFYSRN